jgi:hypothetical protein
MTEDHSPTPNPQVLFTELDDGTGVLLHLDTKFYYTLNPTAVVVWKTLAEGLAEGKGSASTAIAARIADAFLVEPDVAERDVAGILEEMLADGLLLGGRR